MSSSLNSSIGGGLRPLGCVVWAAALLLAGCGGDNASMDATGGGGGSVGPAAAAGKDVAARAAPGVNTESALPGTSDAETAAVAAALASNPDQIAAAAAARGEQAAALGVTRRSRAVLTPADIDRERRTDQDRRAPIDRGGMTSRPAAPGLQAATTSTLHVVGQWSSAFEWPINAIHAVLTPDGNVMSYGSDPAGDQGAQLYYDVWNPSTRAHTLLQHGTRTDLFCNAQTVIPSTGQVLLAGGDTRGLENGTTNRGVPDTNVFDPQLLELRATGTPMQYARWYASLVPMADGRVLALAGGDADGRLAAVPEIYTADAGWQSLSGVLTHSVDAFYPRAFLAPSGHVMIASGDGVHRLDLAAQTLTQVATMPAPTDWTLPWTMFARGKALVLDVLGGAMVINVNGSTPQITRVAGPGVNRIWGSATVLPNGRVLVTGGSSKDNELVDTGYAAMLWNPATNQWTTGASASKARLYHSSALLLPDATVLSTGGGSPGPVINMNAEIYSPPYLFDAYGQRRARPSISSAPAQLAFGGSFSVSVSSSRSISRVTLVRTGSVTHSTNFEQRFAQLPFSQSNGRLTVSFNETANTSPPGRYMLFVIDNAGVPSVARIVKVG